MRHGKPIIGITGGIGSGKSFVARLFGELGCAVFDSDAAVRDAYERADVRQALRDWWGEGVIRPDGSVDRRAVGARVFADAAVRGRLEGLLHPLVAGERDRLMAESARDPAVRAYVWDTPLLFETGLDSACDAIVFVDTPYDVRLERVKTSRGWDAAELDRREKSQWPLDKKRLTSDYVVDNTADAGHARGQVSDVLSRILSQVSGQ